MGYKKFDVRAADGPDYQGIVGDSQLSIRLAKPFVIRGSYVRDVRFSLWYNNPYYIESRPGAGVSDLSVPVPAARLRLFDGAGTAIP